MPRNTRRRERRRSGDRSAGDLGAQPVADDVRAGRRPASASVCPAAWHVAHDERHDRVRRDVRADGRRASWARRNKTPTASRRSSLTGAAACSNSNPAPMTAAIRSRLDSPRDEMIEEAEERRRGVLGVGLGAGVLGEVAQAIEQDGLAELLLGREVAVERAHADAGLLGDDVDGGLDALGGEDHLGRIEDAGPVADCVRAAGGAPRRPARHSLPLPSTSGPRISLPPRLTNGTLVPYSLSGTRTPIPIIGRSGRRNPASPGDLRDQVRGVGGAGSGLEPKDHRTTDHQETGDPQ